MLVVYGGEVVFLGCEFMFLKFYEGVYLFMGVVVGEVEYVYV